MAFQSALYQHKSLDLPGWLKTAVAKCASKFHNTRNKDFAAMQQSLYLLALIHATPTWCRLSDSHAFFSCGTVFIP
jgi:hypothetical protein